MLIEAQLIWEETHLLGHHAATTRATSILEIDWNLLDF